MKIVLTMTLSVLNFGDTLTIFYAMSFGFHFIMGKKGFQKIIIYYCLCVSWCKTVIKLWRSGVKSWCEVVVPHYAQ